MTNYEGRWTTVRVEIDQDIGWVIFNRPEKRNAMSPTLNREMCEILAALELDDAVKVLVLTGAGESWTAGMDLKEYFREIDQAPEIVQERIRRDASTWQWKLLRMYSKPTIAMVNGWCFGGAFSPLVACDLAIASETAVFGVSEINWGIPPGNLVSKAIADTIGQRKALEYIMTGETFTGRQAAEMGLVNRAVPLEQLRDETIALARKLAAKKPGRAARRQARIQALPRTHLGAKRRLSLRQIRPVATPRPRTWPRKGPEAIPRREEHQARPRELSPLTAQGERLSSVHQIDRDNDANRPPPAPALHRARRRFRHARLPRRKRLPQSEKCRVQGRPLPRQSQSVRVIHGHASVGSIRRIA